MSSFDRHVELLQSAAHTQRRLLQYEKYFKLSGRRRVCFVKGLLIARPQLLRMVSRVTRNHAGANASWNHVLESRARVTIRRPTMRAGGLAGTRRARTAVSAKAFFRFDGWSSHQAANANRWVLFQAV